jgi:DNA repair photolyase
MANKKEFQYNGKTGIGNTPEFKRKLLASYSVNLGNVCKFGCSYCYVPSCTRKQKNVLNILAQGYSIDDISSYRSHDNVIKSVSGDLKKRRFKNNNSTVIFSTTCECCATEEDTKTTIKAIRLIMEQSKMQVRVLSKSTLITRVANTLFDYKDRIMYGLSTGTASLAISRAIEERASSITDRVKVLHWLQDKGFRTYGMICPVLPSEVNSVKQLLDQVRPELCEGVWAEAVNPRGKSLVNTFNELMAAGLEVEAKELQPVIGNKKTWSKYATNLFHEFQKEMNDRGLLDKLHFLQYLKSLSKEYRKYFVGIPGAVCL